MAVAYGNPYLLTRTQTAPLGGAAHQANNPGRQSSGGGSGAKSNMANTAHNSLVHSKGHTSSNYSMQSQPSSGSRSSDTTQATTQSTLFPPPMPHNPAALNGADVTATDNVMNTVADANSSLFQICVNLRQRLLGVPGFKDCLEQIEEEADEDTDPVTVLWRTFRQGYPLILLYNTILPDKPLEIPDNVKEEKRGKAATFKFIQACHNVLRFPQEDLFIITDLYADDTTGFVKVTKVANRVLDVLVQRKLIEDIRPTEQDFEQAAQGIKRSHRQHVVHELVTTERTYVQHLEHLQELMKLIEAKGVIAGDAIHDIFLNLNSLLDFQRRFLIRVEQTNLEAEDQQNWGKVFHMYEDAFKVYEPYIANQKKCEKTVVQEYPNLATVTSDAAKHLRQMLESPTSLYGFLMKPFQRLSKYPLLLKEMYEKGDLDEGRKEDLLIGMNVAKEVLGRTNKAVDREEKAAAVQELKMRVEDWKGHRVEGFGELLLYGTFTVLKSETQGSGKDGERQYHVYLFETILLCCKDIDLSKPKNKLSAQKLVDKRGKPKLQLKGRIFMQNVTDLLSIGKPGSYTCQIFWKGDPSIENFIIRFTTEDMMKRWAQQIEMQRRRYRERSGTMRTSDSSRSGGAGTSVTEFDYIRSIGGQLQNPYADDEDDEDEMETVVASGPQSLNGSFVGGGYPYKDDFASSRNGSATSLRSRSTTGESGMSGVTPVNANGRQPPPRYPNGSVQQPPLALRTRELAAQSPGDFAPTDSYFSPLEGSPNQSLSSRTSASSGMYPFPRQQIPQNGYYEEGHGHGTRFTAPAIARQREPSGSAPPNGYPIPNGRPGPPQQRPGMGMHSAQQLPGPPRNRSVSSPDIHNNPRGPMRGVPNGVPTPPPQPPVPDVPLPYQQNPHMIPRSQSNSPNLPGMANTMPPPPQRGMSPHMQRERGFPPQQQQQQSRLPPDPSPTSYSRAFSNGVGAYPAPTSRGMTPLQEHTDNFMPPTFQTQSTAPAVLQAHLPPLAGPTQLKVRVHCSAASQVLTLVVPLNISCQSLKDRIDAKLQRSTQLTLADRGGKEGAGLKEGQTQVKLKFLDDEDFVSIEDDEDVQTAFESWREQLSGAGGGVEGGMGEVDLYCR